MLFVVRMNQFIQIQSRRNKFRDFMLTVELLLSLRGAYLIFAVLEGGLIEGVLIREGGLL